MPAEGTEQLFSQAAKGGVPALGKARKESRNRETNREMEKQEPEPSRSSNPPFFSCLWCLWKLLLQHSEKGFCQKPSLQMSSDPSGGFSAPSTAATFSPLL